MCALAGREGRDGSGRYERDRDQVKRYGHAPLLVLLYRIDVSHQIPHRMPSYHIDPGRTRDAMPLRHGQAAVDFKLPAHH